MQDKMDGSREVSVTIRVWGQAAEFAQRYGCATSAHGARCTLQQGQSGKPRPAPARGAQAGGRSPNRIKADPNYVSATRTVPPAPSARQSVEQLLAGELSEGKHACSRTTH